MRRPDSIVLIAIWQFLSAAGCFIGIAAIALFALPYTWDPGGIFGLSIGIASCACFAGAAIAGGIGLLMLKNWGRILTIVTAALIVMAIPIGTIIGILIIIYLAKENVRQYFIGSQS
jgi:hypothetical protein